MFLWTLLLFRLFERSDETGTVEWTSDVVPTRLSVNGVSLLFNLGWDSFY